MNTKVIVDAGHGGNDPGAVNGNIKEKDLTLQAAKYIDRRLKELGINSVLTRDDDEYLPREDRIRRINSLANNQPAILISNHINAGGGEGAEIVYALRNDSTLADITLQNIGEVGQIKRKVYQRRLPENPNLDYYYILRESGQNTEPILIEYGFIDNIKDQNKLLNYLDNYAEAVVKAIAEYTNTPYLEPNTSEQYTVQRGDTLYSISKKFNISINKLKELNNLESNTILPGQKLIIKEPTNPPQPTTYKVQKGDTLYSISQKFNTTVDEIKRLNNISSNNIYINQELYIPSTNTLPSPPLPIPPINDDENEEYSEYIVQKGDSLWKISRDYNISVKDLIELNNLTTTTLQIGDKLLVPIQTNNEKTYIVKRGDTLWSIAKENNITVNELKEKNNLTTNLLSIGQTIIIP
jgi:LysM repeat protein